MPTSGGVSKALIRGRDTGCEAVQLFVKNNMRWLGQPFPEAEVAEFSRLRKEIDFSCVFAHSGYLINLAAPASPNWETSLKSLAQELELCETLGLPFLVMHPGAHLGSGVEAGLGQVVRGLDEVFAAAISGKVKIALEGTAGQGSCLGSELAHLFDIIRRTRHSNRLALCLDTAHLFEAGQDIRRPEVWDALMAEIDRELGVKRVAAFHLNDSRTDLGSRVDRHAGIGEGKIGIEAFRHILNDSRFQDTPGCLETPKSPDLHEDVENLARLRGLLDPNGPRLQTAAKPKRKPRLQGQ
jgi:deoxyribonuclease-4